jgi:hypothetical protein
MMIRLALAALLGAVVGAVVAGGVSLLAFAYPIRTEVSNFPLDDGGNFRIVGTIQTTVDLQSAGQPQEGVGELLAWRDAQPLQCVCSETR